MSERDLRMTYGWLCRAPYIGFNGRKQRREAAWRKCQADSRPIGIAFDLFVTPTASIRRRRRGLASQNDGIGQQQVGRSDFRINDRREGHRGGTADAVLVELHQGVVSH